MISKMATAAILTVGLAGQSFAAECIAPANPGGGWDFTCRSITKIMNDIGAVDGGHSSHQHGWRWRRLSLHAMW